VSATTTFFRSRWVEAPAGVRELDPAALPQGFRAAGTAAGLKRQGLDVGVLVCDSPDATSAARFTTNARVGAPVIASKEADLGRLRAIVANAGGSNVGDGQRGLDTARASQTLAAEVLGIEPAQVGVASTGVIGTELPRQILLDGVRQACAGLGDDADDFSLAILTSDSGPKRACLELDLSGGTVRLSAQVKGAGMISPRFATMFCFVQTDALMDQGTVDLLTGVTVKRSFDRVSVDGQLSTSDTVFTIAGGASGVLIEPESQDELQFGQAMDALLRQLAIDMVGDGEGAKRVGRVIVTGHVDAVEVVARAVADSPLVKTALHGADPNFGRILQAAGAVWPEGLPFLPDLEIAGVQLVSAGEAMPLDAGEKEALDAEAARTEVEYLLTLPGEGGQAEVYFSDLSKEYVAYNAEYTS
jgi:glutamate N-acetyltransferase/amino-acid N-acetyltransferase